MDAESSTDYPRTTTHSVIDPFFVIPSARERNSTIEEHEKTLRNSGAENLLVFSKQSGVENYSPVTFQSKDCGGWPESSEISEYSP